MANKYFKNSTYKPKIFTKVRLLLTIAILTVLSIIILNLSTEKSKIFGYENMVATAEKMIIVYNEIQKYRSNNDLPINELLDPNKTGFIGEEFSVITTTLGDLDAKQISLNPDFAALMFKWMLELNLSQNDTVVIHASASFPALTIMSIVACEELNLEPVVFSSIGSSSWGANHTRLTYLDIENHLFNKGIIKHRSFFVTPGSTNDNGSSLWEGGLETIENSALRNNYNLQIPDSLEDAINKKWRLIKKHKPDLFINIGGNHSAMGTGNCALNIPVGLIDFFLDCLGNNTKGLIYKCNQENIPVLHFLKIKDIAFVNGISLSPIFSNSLGETEIYYVKKISISIAIILFVVLFSLLFFLKQKKL